MTPEEVAKLEPVGEFGSKAWCEACAAGYVDGDKTRCQACFEAKQGGPGCEACAQRRRPPAARTVPSTGAGSG